MQLRVFYTKILTVCRSHLFLPNILYQHMEDIKQTSDYQKEFDPQAYLHVTYTKFFNVNNDETGLLEFRMKPLHVFWSNFQACSPADESGVRCLEYGGGASIANLISAATKVDHIVFAEHLGANRKAVKSWIAGSPTAYNWSPLVEYVVRNLERNSDPKAVSDREVELKRKIKSIVYCDVTKDSIIVDLDTFDLGKPFDVVTTSSCVEVCAFSKEHYKITVAKLCKMLKPNGYLCMSGVFDESFYAFGEAKFCHYPVSRITLDEAMKEAGLEDIKVEVFSVGHLNFSEATNATAFFFASGRMSEKRNKGK